MRKILKVVLIAAVLVLCCFIPVACNSNGKTPLASPTIRLDGDVVGWNAVDNAAQYDVYVNGEKTDTVDKTYYTVVATVAGDYEVKIKAVPSEEKYAESDFSNAVVYTAEQKGGKLAAPVVSGSRGIVEWKAVEHATSYVVYLDGEKLGTTSKPWYVLPELNDGAYEVKVVAQSANPFYTDSDCGVYNYHTGDPIPERLSSPVITLSGNVVSWTAVANAESYDVIVNDKLKATVTDTEYTLNVTAYGNYSVTVIAKSTDELYADSYQSNAVVYEIKRPKLDAPVISLNGGTVSWTAVDNAAAYEIYINGTLRATTGFTEYTVYVSVAGTYNIKVKAVGTDYDSSDFSNTEVYNYTPPAVPLSAPVITLNGNLVGWQAVVGAASYKVYINDELEATVTTTSYTVTETEVGHYTVKVCAVPDDSAFGESPLSNGVMLSVVSPDAQPIDSPEISITGSVVSWSAVANAQTYDVYCGETLLGSVEELNYSLEELTAAGDYEISVIAKPADLLRYKNSAPCAPVTYTVAKVAAYIEITSYPTKDIYFTDEAQAGLDLDGLEAVIHYSNYDGTDPVELAVSDASGYDLTVSGRYEIEFTKNGVISDTVRIYVRERTIADISGDYITVVNGYSASATEYSVTDSSFTATLAYTASGVGFTVTNGKVPASALHEGENLVRLSNGSTSAYALVKVARIITTAEEFQNIVNALDGYYMLGANIDFGGKGFVIGAAPLLIDWENKAEHKAAKVYAPRDGVGCEEAPGQLFTGTLDGCGYVLSNFKYRTGDGGYSNRWTTSGVALFGGVGKTGIIRNLVLRDFHVNSTGACALLAGYNAGLIENISIEEDCSVGYHWDAGAGISAYNYGVVRNCVSHLATVTLDRNNSDQPMYLTHFGGSSYEVDNGINGFVGVKDDLTDVLGDGWYYIPGYGTYYGNLQYKKVISYDSVWYATQPSRVVIFHAKPGLTGLYMHAWGGPGGAVSLNKISTSGRISVYECTLGASFTAGTAVSVGVRYNDNNVYFTKLNIEIGSPYPTSATCNDAVEVYQGGIIQLQSVSLTVTMSDGSTKTVAPTGYVESEFDSSKPVGTVQSVTFFYTEGGQEAAVGVNISIVNPPATAYATSLTITKKSDSVSYGKNAAIDFDSVLSFTANLSDGGTRNLTLAGDSTLTAGDYSPGHRTVTFTYTDPEVAIQVTGTVELDIVYTIADKDDWKLMNTYLDGYFELKSDIDLGGVAESNNPLVIGKLPLDASSETDSTGAGNDATQLGVAFTGRFNGNGYKVKGFASDFAKNTGNAAAWAPTSYGLVPFAYVGEGGVVENFTLYGASIRCGQSGSLLVGLNKGTVKDVVIDSNCSLFVHYGGANTGAIANTNCGTLTNIVCKVTGFIGFGSAEMDFVNTVYATKGGTETGCKIESGEVA